MPGGDPLQGHEAHVVAVARVALARIAEAYEELHGELPVVAPGVQLGPAEARPRQPIWGLLLALVATLGGSSCGLGASGVLAGGSLGASGRLGVGRSGGSTLGGGRGGTLGGRSAGRTRRRALLLDPVAGDGGDREVTALDGGLHAGRQGDGRDMDGAADLEAVQAELERIGDGVG